MHGVKSLRFDKPFIRQPSKTITNIDFLDLIPIEQAVVCAAIALEKQ